MRSIRLAAVALGLALAGCATQPATEVTRFHLGQPIPSDSIALVPVPGGDANSLEFRSQAAIVARDLDAVGLHPATDARSGYVGTLKIEQSTRIGPPRSSPFQIGIGGGTGGFGGGVSVPVGAPRTGEVRTNLLSLQIRRRSDASMVWEGRAVQDIAADAPGLGAHRRAAGAVEGAVQQFPGPSGETVKVKTTK